MLENTESLLPLHSRNNPYKVIVVAADSGPDSVGEILRLTETLELKTLQTFIVQLRKISPATYLTEGKLAELKMLSQSLKADAVILDFELSPNQLKNVEQDLGIPVLDRSGVIIEIFSQHAKTSEAKTQVELARLTYLLPRLAHFWSHFERQRGGGTGNRGMGETQIEVDRRLVKNRMSVLRERLKTIGKERNVQRSGRRDILKVACIGYTNAGKSTLLNALTHSRVLAEDKLFATLDSTVRALDPDSKPPLVAIDTVGFIKNLPPTLVASFRSTLEELEYADLLLHIVDASSPSAREELEVTEKVLADLKLLDKPRMVVLNKKDQLKTMQQQVEAKLVKVGATLISALDDDDVNRLRKEIVEHFRKSFTTLELMVPYGEGKTESILHTYGTIEASRHMEKGTFFKVRMEEAWIQKFSLNRYRL